MTSAAGRAGVSAFATGSAFGAASGGRARGREATAVESFATAACLAPLNIGAGCEPVCSSRPLMTMAMVAHAPMANARASLRLQPKASSTHQRGRSSTLVLRDALGTDLHPVFWFDAARSRILDDAALAGAPAIERQADRDPRPLPDLACDAQIAAMQRQ